MNHLDEWDYEIHAISEELAAIEKDLSRGQNRERRGLVQLNNCIFQIQNLFSQTLDKLVTLSKRGEVLAPMERSIIRWGAVYAEKCHSFYIHQVQQMSKHMWIKLLGTKLTKGNQKSEIDLSDQHLVEISNKRTKLLETERFLRQHQLKLDRTKSELHYTYEDLRTSMANQEAAGSMSATLGKDPRDAFSHPAVAAVSKYIKMLAKGLQSNDSRYQYMKDLSEAIGLQTSQVLSRCRNHVLDEVRYPKVENLTKKLSEYEQSLEKIQNLQTQLTQAVGLLYQNPGPARPNLMKKSGIRVTNISRS